MPDSDSDSPSLTDAVTVWIEGVKAGDSQAAQRLWEQYFARMVELARRKLEGLGRAAADEEDVAISAFKSFCIGARQGRFTQLVDRHNLWPLLLTITANKSIDLLRRQNRLKRGGRPDQRPRNASEGAGYVPLSQLLSKEPDPAFATAVAEELQRLLSRLETTGDLDLKRIAIWRMDGDSTTEIAQKLGKKKQRRLLKKKSIISELAYNDPCSP